MYRPLVGLADKSKHQIGTPVLHNLHTWLFQKYGDPLYLPTMTTEFFLQKQQTWEFWLQVKSLITSWGYKNKHGSFNTKAYTLPSLLQKHLNN